MTYKEGLKKWYKTNLSPLRAEINTDVRDEKKKREECKYIIL